MQVADAQERLLSLLQEAGQEPHRLEPRPGWKVFGSFMQHPVQAEQDALLYEYGTYAFSGPRRFTLAFCRQFDIDQDGAPALIQLRCEIEYEPAPALEALGTHNHWWCGAEDEPSLAAVLDEIGGRPEWEVIGAHRPVASSVCQETVC